MATTRNLIKHGPRKDPCQCGATTSDEVRKCQNAPDPRVTGKQQTFLKNGIKEAQLLPEHFTKDGLAHVAQILGLSTTGTKDDLAGRIREVL